MGNTRITCTKTNFMLPYRAQMSYDVNVNSETAARLASNPGKVIMPLNWIFFFSTSADLKVSITSFHVFPRLT